LRLGVINEHKVLIAVVFLVGAGITAFQAGAYYYYQRSIACPNPCQGSVVSVDTLINYGNGTGKWINRTDVPSDWNFYQLTASISKVEATYYGPPTSEHLIAGINGVRGDGTHFWSLWGVCEKSKAWIATSVGADAIHFTTYHKLAWYFQVLKSQDSSSWDPPVLGAAKVTSCS
jgi:hypothetical protein